MAEAVTNQRHLLRGDGLVGDSPPTSNAQQLPRLTVVHPVVDPDRPRGLIVTTDRQWCTSLLKTGLIDVTLSTATALAWLSERSYAALFVDKGTMDGGMNGFRFARIIQSSKAGNCPTFVLAESITAYDQEYAKQNGAQGLLFRSENSLRQILQAAASPETKATGSSKIDPIWRQRLKRCIAPILGRGGVTALDRALDKSAVLATENLSSSDMVNVACQLFGERRDLADRYVRSVRVDYEQSKRDAK